MANGQAGRHNRWGGVVMTLLTLILLLTACSDPSTVPAGPTSTPTVNAAQQSAKVDTVLRDLLVAYQSGGIQAAHDYAVRVGLLDDQDRVRFGLVLSSAAAAPAITSQIKQMGGEVYSSNGNELAVAVKLDKLTAYFNSQAKHDFFQELASFKEVQELKILLKPALASLSAANEGIGVVGADQWQQAGFSGKGIKVGIVDGGFAGWRNFLGTALPATSQVEFKSFLLGDGEGSEAHGVAVAEIVHSLAPDAQLILTPIEDEIGFTRAVQYLIDRKVQIIQLSLGWAGIFPGDGSGKMDEILDRARQAGILPVVSTGNYGQAHYLGQLQTDQGGFQQFDDGATRLRLDSEADLAWVSLHWEENWDAPQTNLDLYILDSAGRPLVSSRNEQGPGSAKPPTELAPFRTQPDQVYYIQVRLNGSAPAKPLKFHLFAYNARLSQSTPTESVATPGDARGALSVGAVNWQNDGLETYSSRGPTLDGRAKPELVAPSGITSAVMKGSFSGTSAAAPQVAGAAALLWSAAREMTAEQVAVYLARNARDLGPPGRDGDTGFGRLRLGSAETAQGGLLELTGPMPSGPLFQDNFASSASGLPNNGLARYEPDGYRVAAPGGEFNWNTYLNRPFEQFQAEIRAQPPTDQPDLFYGLIFWQQGPQDYYAWLINGRRYAILRRSGQQWLNLSAWSQDAALTPDANGLVALKLEATAGYLRLRANGTLLQSLVLRPKSQAAPPAHLGGKFGLGAGRFGGIVAGNQSTNQAEPKEPSVVFKSLVVTPLQ